MATKPGVGFIGSGFVTKFHLQAWRGVRDADVLGYSPDIQLIYPIGSVTAAGYEPTPIDFGFPEL